MCDSENFDVIDPLLLHKTVGEKEIFGEFFLRDKELTLSWVKFLCMYFNVWVPVIILVDMSLRWRLFSWERLAFRIRWTYFASCKSVWFRAWWSAALPIRVMQASLSRCSAWRRGRSGTSTMASTSRPSSSSCFSLRWSSLVRARASDRHVGGWLAGYPALQLQVGEEPVNVVVR